MLSTGTPLNLDLPDFNSTGWDDPVNNNFAALNKFATDTNTALANKVNFGDYGLAGTIGAVAPNDDPNQISVSGIYRFPLGIPNTLGVQFGIGSAEIILHLNWNEDTQCQIAGNGGLILGYRFKGALTGFVWSSWQKLAVNDAAQVWIDPVYSNGYGSTSDGNRLQYSKNGLGEVIVSGRFVKTTSPINPLETIITMPAGFRPGKTLDIVISPVQSGPTIIGAIMINGIIGINNYAIPAYTANTYMSIYSIYKAIY